MAGDLLGQIKHHDWTDYLQERNEKRAAEFTATMDPSVCDGSEDSLVGWGELLI